jgi:hypothetical protein
LEKEIDTTRDYEGEGVQGEKKREDEGEEKRFNEHYTILRPFLFSFLLLIFLILFFYFLFFFLYIILLIFLFSLLFSLLLLIIFILSFLPPLHLSLHRPFF